MKGWNSAKISTKLTVQYSLIFFAVLLFLTFSTYFGVDYFLNKQAKDSLVLSSSSLSQNIYSSVDAAIKAAEKEAAESEASNDNQDSEDSDSSEDSEDLQDDDRLVETGTLGEDVWKIGNSPLGLGISAALYDKNGTLINANSTAVISKVSYAETPGKVIDYNEDDHRIFVLNTVLSISNQPYYLQVVKEMQEETSFLHLLLGALLVVDMIGLLLAFLTGLIISKKMLRPIESITKSTRRINMNDLHQRISIQGPDDELKRLSITINEMLDRLENSFEKQVRFVSDASHELRTPVQVIAGYSSMLERWGKNDPSVLDESVTAIRKEAANMKMLIEKLLFLARNDSATTSLQRERFDAAKMVRQTVKETRMIDDSHTIVSNTDPSAVDASEADNAAPVMLDADPNLIREMLRAVIDNSLKYTPEGGTIQIDLFHKENAVIFNIADSGIGIPKEKIPFIFDRFYRADAARSKETIGNRAETTATEAAKSNAAGGAGLGLSIVKWIVDAHDGRITAESSDSTGLTVRIEIPDGAH